MDSFISKIDQSATSLTWGDESDRMSEQRTLNGDCKGGSFESAGQFSVSPWLIHAFAILLLVMYENVLYLIRANNRET